MPRFDPKQARFHLFCARMTYVSRISCMQRWEIISYHTKSVEQIVYAKIVIFRSLGSSLL